MRLEYERFSVPLKSPLETAAGTIDSREGFLVRAIEDDTVGLGEATPLPGWTEPIEECADALERASAAIESGDLAGAIEVIEDTSAARHGVTLAIADAQAIERATPLYQHLCASGRVARVPANATVGDGSPEETARAASDAVDRGFSCCKLKVGVRSVEEDVERLSRVRDVVGPDVELRADANGAWTFEEAEHAIEAFADLEVSLVEQPLPAGALEGHAELRGRGVDVALDEGLLAHGIDTIAEADAADAVVLKPMALGGVDVARELAAWADQLGLYAIVTTTIDAVVARTAAVHLAASIPDVPACGIATADLLETDIGRDPVLFENGAAVVPQAKGLGISESHLE